MAKPEPVKVTSKQRIEELQATVSFLTNARHTLTHAGSILKGENDKLKIALSITEKKLQNLQNQYDADEKEFNDALVRIDELITETKRISAERDKYNTAYEAQLRYTKSNYESVQLYVSRLNDSDRKLMLTSLGLLIAAIPYGYFVISWVFTHIRICLH